jgi:hypothetical protein
MPPLFFRESRIFAQTLINNCCCCCSTFSDLESKISLEFVEESFTAPLISVSSVPSCRIRSTLQPTSRSRACELGNTKERHYGPDGGHGSGGEQKNFVPRDCPAKLRAARSCLLPTPVFSSTETLCYCTVRGTVGLVDEREVRCC